MPALKLASIVLTERRSGANDHRKQKPGITRPRPDGGVIMKENGYY